MDVTIYFCTEYTITIEFFFCIVGFLHCNNKQKADLKFLFFHAYIIGLMLEFATAILKTIS